jgi:hypothetical protein
MAQGRQTVAIVIIIVLILYCVAMGVLVGITSAGLKGCETTESPHCTSFFCRNQDLSLCSSRPFRYDANGHKQCQFTAAPNYLDKSKFPT